MVHRILIVDDDQEFNLLLTDVFAQADYEIETCCDVASALKRLAEGDIDLLVTDFRMPGPSGLDLIKQVRERDPDLPVIMVSGFLENGMIRDLIRYGVGGIFIKPLNIFSLLKKTEELIDREDVREANQAGAPTSGFGANVGYPFRAYPCRDRHSREFAKRVYDLRDFPKNLLLIGEGGTDLRTICADLVAAGEHCPKALFFHPENFGPEVARKALAEEGAGQTSGLTLVFEQAERLSPEQREIVYAMARAEGDFAAADSPRRFIFCLDRELDDYYDEGLIDEAFYLFLGTTELKCPRLHDIPEDLPVIAETILARECGGKELEGAARAFLQRHDWQGNLATFSDNLRLAARLCRNSVVTVEDLRGVIEGRTGENAESTAPTEASPLEGFLRHRRDDYLAAFQKLVGRLPSTRDHVAPTAPAS